VRTIEERGKENEAKGQEREGGKCEESKGREEGVSSDERENA
jgi:hypothetical protein